MKKILYVLMSGIMMVSLCSCKEEKKDNDNKVIQEGMVNGDYVNLSSDITMEQLEELIDTDVAETIDAINGKWDSLKSEVNSYDKYLDNVNVVEAFYEGVYDDTRLLCIRLREYAYAYANLIVESDMSFDDMKDACGEIYDIIYDDACGEIYDEIYDNLLDDIYDYYYDGILDDAYDNEEYESYEEWSEVLSDEYELWSETLSDVYSEYSDVMNDTYAFYSDLRRELHDEDMEETLEIIGDFKEVISDLKN